MKREIKFRAKRIDNGEWDYGYYVVHHIALTDVDKDTNQIVRVGTNVVHTLFNDQRKDNNGYYKDINPDTLGQFTGLLDKNGKEIYEGDIIRVNPTDSGIRYVKWDDRHAQFVSQMLHNEQYYLISHNDSQVIGNMFDNPELLKGGEQ